MSIVWRRYLRTIRRFLEATRAMLAQYVGGVNAILDSALRGWVY